MNREFIDALDDLEKEQHIPKSVLLEAIESALVAAYKKNYGIGTKMESAETHSIALSIVWLRIDVK